MLCSSSFSSFSSEDGSELNSDSSSVILGDSEASFVPYDEDLEPLATQEEAAAYEANMALKQSGNSSSKGALRAKLTSEHVTLATKAEECICCKEIGRVDETKAGNSYRTIFSQGLKSESEFPQSVSYSHFSKLLWDFSGHLRALSFTLLHVKSNHDSISK
ncbi:uncharacterized protein [Montipora capricornis]|uniref:uncharacterized protein isoform X1 n=1 Tax=Montipora capricornis TaxID=246305 RepID=UPI0035F1C11F